MVIPQLVAGRAAAAARAPLLQAVVRAAAVVHRAVGEAHLWAEEHRRSARRGRGGTARRAPPLAAPSAPPRLSRAQRAAQPGPRLTVQAEAALPAPAAVAAKASDAVDARAVAAARTVARVLRGPDLALVAVCHMGFGVVIGAPASSPSPQPPRYLKEEGRGHRSKESGEHSPKYLDQKASCGEKRPRQALSAHVCIRGPS